MIRCQNITFANLIYIIKNNENIMKIIRKIKDINYFKFFVGIKK